MCSNNEIKYEKDLLREAELLVGGLTKTSKMPGYSYSLPATSCNIGNQLFPLKNSICSSCYARKGCYRFSVVKKAQEKRLQSLTDINWLPSMIFLIGHKCKKVKYFRWHDSGDIQDINHLDNIVTIAKELPDIKFWLPTKEYILIHAYTKVIPKNLNIRLSQYFINQKPLENMFIKNSKKGVGNACTYKDEKDVPKDFTICPAFRTEGQCKRCRACWDIKKYPTIVYLLH